jgi:hypothetical protein
LKKSSMPNMARTAHALGRTTAEPTKNSHPRSACSGSADHEHKQALTAEGRALYISRDEARVRQALDRAIAGADAR